jgi:hypothetical protein
MPMPTYNEFFTNEEQATGAAVQALVQVLQPLNDSVRALAANNFPENAQRRYLAFMAEVIGALYREVPLTSQAKVQGLVDKELFGVEPSSTSGEDSGSETAPERGQT